MFVSCRRSIRCALFTIRADQFDYPSSIRSNEIQSQIKTGQRRAFVDYTSASSARIAIKALDNYVIDGFRTHVDYAIVQRSGGYRPITHNRTPARPIPYSRPSQFVISSPIMDVPSLPPSDPNAATLIVDHLPDISFNSHQLTSLFLPYGRVLYSQISTDTRTDEVVGVIILGNEMQAERARIQCDGVWIMNRPIRVRSWKSIENEPVSWVLVFCLASNIKELIPFRSE